MANKLLFAQTGQRLATTLADTISEADEWVSAYFDRTYGSGGAAEIVDGDVSSLGITAANLAALVTLSQQLKNFRDNAAVTQGDYGSTLSKMRTDL